jgi:hypothetical protein
MDLSFFRRAEARFASRTAARPDHGMLVAMLRAQQAASETGRVQARFAARPDLEDALVELLLAGPRWRLASAALRGRFRPAPVRQGAVN